MTVATQTRSLASLARALRAAQVVLVPVDAAAPLPVATDPTDMLQSLCTSGSARALVARAAARWAISSPAPLEPREGLAVLPVPMPRNLSGVRYAAVALLGEALRSETIEQLAHGARADARLARTLLAPSACWTRASLPALASLIASLVHSEGERLAGEEASARLGAAWEELHLLHSLSGDMTVGSAPRVFVTRALGELRATLGCRWTALRITGAAEPLFDMSLGGVFSDGIGALDARRIMFEAQAPAQALAARWRQFALTNPQWRGCPATARASQQMPPVRQPLVLPTPLRLGEWFRRVLSGRPSGRTTRLRSGRPVPRWRRAGPVRARTAARIARHSS